MAEIPYDDHSRKAPEEASGSGADYTPTPEEKKTIKLVESLFEKAKKNRARYDEKWLDYYRFFRGRQWKEPRPSYRSSEVINMIFQSIQSTVPIQLDSRPKIRYTPTEPSDREVAEILNQLVDSDWTRGNWLQDLTEIVYDANIYGTGLGCLTWDPEAEHGAGAICYKSEDPFYFYPDPNARDVNKECEYVVTATPKDVDWIKKKHPDFAKYIKPDILDMKKSAKSDMAQMKFRQPLDQKTGFDYYSNMEMGDSDKALYIVCYCKSTEFEEEEVEQENKDTGLKEKIIRAKLKYPYGRKIIVCNGVLLENSGNPYEDGEFPYQRLTNYVLPREFWGISEIEQLEGPQKTFNKIISFALDVLTLTGNPIWVVDTTAGIDTDNLVNRPGIVVEKEPGTEVRREAGVQLQPYVLQLAEYYRNWFNGISGSQDVSRGVQPTGITAASAIDSLQEAAQTRLRQKSRNMDACIQSLGQQYSSRVFQYYTVPRVVRITNNEAAEKYFKMQVSDAVDPEKGWVKQVTVWPLNEAGQMNPDDVRTYQIRGAFDVSVSTGSSLPFAKNEKEGKLYQLFDRGIIDQEQVLKDIDYPNWESILQRMQEKAQAAAEAAPPPK